MCPSAKDDWPCRRGNGTLTASMAQPNTVGCPCRNRKDCSGLGCSPKDSCRRSDLRANVTACVVLNKDRTPRPRATLGAQSPSDKHRGDDVPRAAYDRAGAIRIKEIPLDRDAAGIRDARQSEKPIVCRVKAFGRIVTAHNSSTYRIPHAYWSSIAVDVPTRSLMSCQCGEIDVAGLVSTPEL